MVEKNKNGCPCGPDCCSDPKIFTSEHTCSKDEFCEECYGSECENCGALCYCEL